MTICLAAVVTDIILINIFKYTRAANLDDRLHGL